MKPIFKFIILILLTHSAVTIGQITRRATADKYYNQLDYAFASPIYNELATKALKTKKENPSKWELLKKTAESNRMCGNLKLAEKWYAELDKANQLATEDALIYLKLLIQNKNYSTAEKLVLKEFDRSANNPLLQEARELEDHIKIWTADSANFIIKETEVNSGYGDFSPAFYDEGIVFASKRKNTGFVNNKYGWDNSFFIDMYYSPKTKKGNTNPDLKADASLLKTNEFKAKPHDGPATFNKNYTKAYITRNDIEASKKDKFVKLMLYESERNADNEWVTQKPFPYNNKEYSVGHASISNDGKTLYFVSDMPGGYGGADIYVSRLKDGSWTKPENLGNKINTNGNELFPSISNGGNLYYSSDGKLGMGGLDIFKSEYRNGAFEKPENMGYPLNTSSDDFSLILDSLEENGYLSSNRNDNIDRIYSVKIIPTSILLKGNLSNDKEHKPIPFNPIKITNLKTKEVNIVKSDSNGLFYFPLKKGMEYEISSEKKYYSLKSKELVKDFNKNKSDTVNVNLYLKPTGIFLLAHVEEELTKKVLPGSLVTITNLKSGVQTSYTADQMSDVEIVAERFTEYKILAQKKGYFDKTVTVKTGDLSADEILDLGMSKISKGAVIQVENIYYDLAKWDIRKDSEIELNKLAKFLIENDNIKVELSSHTDSRSSDSYNLTLSQKRAQSATDYLIKQGVLSQNIIAKGYGETQLVNGCSNNKKCSEKEHQANRRTELKILDIKD